MPSNRNQQNNNRNRGRKQKDISDIRKEVIGHFKSHPIEDLLKLESIANPNALFKELESLVESNAKGISTTQLRKLFDIVKEAKDRKALMIQRPQFAHMIAKRANKWEDMQAKKIMLLVDELAARAGQDDVLFAGFPFFTETLVAFHKYYEVLNKRYLKPNKVSKMVGIEMGAIHPNDLFQFGKSEKTDQIIDQLQKFIKKNEKGVTATQLRNIYTKVLHSVPKNKLAHLKPVLAYTAARQDNQEAQKLIYFIISMVGNIRTESDKTAFLNIMETILSIHKFEETARKGRLNLYELKNEIVDYFGKLWSPLLKMEVHKKYAEIQEKLQQFVLFNRGEGIKAAQFRRLYDEVMKKDDEDIQAFKTLRPLFLYTMARQNNLQSKKIIYFFTLLIKKIREKEEIIGFKILMEDLLAYHRYFEETRTNSKPQTIKKLTI